MNPNDPQTTGTGGWTMGAFSDDPEKVEMCMEFTKEVFIGEGNQVTGQLPTSESLFDELDKFDDPIYDTFAEGLQDGEARPGRPGLPGDLQPAPDRHRHRPHRRGDAGGGPRRGVPELALGLRGTAEVMQETHDDQTGLRPSAAASARTRPTLWMAPLLAVVTLFYLYPAFEVLRFSFTNASLAAGRITNTP